MSIDLCSHELPVFAGYFDEIPERDDGIFHARMPVDLQFDPRSGLVHQRVTQKQQRRLNEIYEAGSTWYQAHATGSFQQAEHVRSRNRQFLELLFSVVGERELGGRRVLEVGCGPGYLLDEFKRRGADAIGCDPGPYAAFAREKFGIEIVQAFFSGDVFEERSFDLIYSTATVTGMDDALGVLESMRRLLRPGGRLVTAVADYGTHLELGNVFCLSPEQINYFTAASARNLYRLAGLASCELRSARYGMGLQISGQRDAGAPAAAVCGIEALCRQATAFAGKASRYLDALQERLDASPARSVGFMGANVETANLLHLLDPGDREILLYEYDESFVGRYLPGAPYRIRHERHVVDDRPDEVWIVPLAFAEKIERKLRGELRVDSRIVSLLDVLKRLNAAPAAGGDSRPADP